MSVLSIKNLTLKFGGLVAVNDVSLEVPGNSIVSVIGPNGAGKTTLFNAVTGIYRVNSGQVETRGIPLASPLKPIVIVRAFLLGMVFGLCSIMLFNIQALWENSINALFIYGQDFSWAKSFQEFWRTLSAIPPKELALQFLLAFFASSAGYISLWSKYRSAPYRIARRGISRTFQNIRLCGQLTVLDNVLIGMDSRFKATLLDVFLHTTRYKNEDAQRTSEALELLSFVGLQGLEKKEAGALPYGLQRRLEIARALASNPNIILLDEPAAGINPTELKDLLTLIRDIRTRGVTVLLIEHHMKLVMEISESITVLVHGNNIASGTPEEIAKNKLVIEAYLGTGEH